MLQDKINLHPAVTTDGPFAGRTPLFAMELHGITTRTKKNSMEIHYNWRKDSKRCPVCHRPYNSWPAQSKQSRAFESEVKARISALLPDDYAVPTVPLTLCWESYINYKPEKGIDLSNVIGALDDAAKGLLFIDDDWSHVKSHRGSQIGYDKDNPHIVLRAYAYDPEQD